VDIHKIEKIEQNLYGKMDSSYKALTESILEQQTLTPEIEEQMIALIQETIKEI
jgi:F0F1-type ATP synthase alpha subunit